MPTTELYLGKKRILRGKASQLVTLEVQINEYMQDLKSRDVLTNGRLRQSAD